MRLGDRGREQPGGQFSHGGAAVVDGAKPVASGQRPGLAQAQEKLNLTGVMWTAIGRDWKWSASKISKLLLNQAKDGAILCLHDGRALQASPDIQATLETVKFILPILKERGFSLETVTEIRR